MLRLRRGQIGLHRVEPIDLVHDFQLAIGLAGGLAQRFGGVKAILGNGLIEKLRSQVGQSRVFRSLRCGKDGCLEHVGRFRQQIGLTARRPVAENADCHPQIASRRRHALSLEQQRCLPCRLARRLVGLFFERAGEGNLLVGAFGRGELSRVFGLHLRRGIGDGGGAGGAGLRHFGRLCFDWRCRSTEQPLAGA